MDGLLLFLQGANSHGQLGQNCISEQFAVPTQLNYTVSNDIKEIVCGGGHTLLIDSEGKLYACGWNHRRQLGCDGDSCNTFSRVWDLSGINFHKIAAGWDSSTAITEKQIIYVWGSNSYGQLGLPCNEFPKSVRPIQLELKVKDVSMGLRHTVLLDINGNIWTTGCGKKGELGHGTDILSLEKFKKNEILFGINSIACGQSHTLAWNELECKLYAWGDNTYGQLGIEESGTRIYVPTIANMLNSYVNLLVKIYAGWTNNAILLKNGEAVYWGRNNYNQLGCETTSQDKLNIIKFKGKKICQLALGSEHTICLLDDNTLWSWGWNEHGNTGIVCDTNVQIPTKIKTFTDEIHYIAAGTGHNFIITESTTKNQASDKSQTKT